MTAIVKGGVWVDSFDSFLRRAGWGLGGGASSVSSTVMSRVTNFLIPWRWKSMEVRSGVRLCHHAETVLSVLDELAFRE